MTNQKKKDRHPHPKEEKVLSQRLDVINSPPPTEGPQAGSMGNTEDRQGQLGEDARKED